MTFISRLPSLLKRETEDRDRFAQSLVQRVHAHAKESAQSMTAWWQTSTSAASVAAERLRSLIKLPADKISRSGCDAYYFSSLTESAAFTTVAIFVYEVSQGDHGALTGLIKNLIAFLVDLLLLEQVFPGLQRMASHKLNRHTSYASSDLDCGKNWILITSHFLTKVDKVRSMNGHSISCEMRMLSL